MIDIGLIGFGSWPRQTYAPILKEIEGARVVAVSARSVETQTIARATFGQDIVTFGNYADLLADASIEAVMVAVPNHLHAEATQAAIASGKHVFFEPPAGLGEEQVGQTLAAARESGQVVQVDLELRYLPVMDFVAAKLASGDLGDPIMATIRLWCDWGFGGLEWQEEVESQGFFPWLGCWYVDVLDQVFAELPERVSVTGGYAMSGKAMDHGWASFAYSDGRIGQFEMNMCLPEGQEVSLAVACTRGELVADLWHGTCRWRGTENVWREVAAPPSQPVYGFSGMRESIEGFINAIAGGETLKANMEVCGRVEATVLACARSEQEKRSVEVEGV